MKKEKKELIKQFNLLIEDLLDNYEKYTDEEKAQIKELFQKVSELNAILDKYDIVSDFSWQEYFLSLGQFFDVMYH